MTSFYGKRQVFLFLFHYIWGSFMIKMNVCAIHTYNISYYCIWTMNKKLNTDILSWLKTDISYHLKNSLNLIFPYVFRISVFLAYFENRWNLKYSPLASMIFIHNVLHQMMLLLEVEQDSKEAYKKLQCQQKIYISRK